MARPLPFPPLALMNRVGTVQGAPDPATRYDQLGKAIREALERQLPPSWDWRRKAVLDFGCGAGRALRQFASEAEEADFWGCDIDAESVRWIEENLDPPFHAVHTAELPPLPFADGSFHLVYAVSVFTHLPDTWAQWLLELRRVLRDDGIFVATFMGEGMSDDVAREPWDDSRVGMNVLAYGQPWDRGGPMVLHSPWWIASHWGRLFEIERLEPYGFASESADSSPRGHGVVVMRPRQERCTVEDLLAPEPGEPRELSSARHHITQLAREVAWLRDELGHVSKQRDAMQEQLDRHTAVHPEPAPGGCLEEARGAGGRTGRLLARISTRAPTGNPRTTEGK